MKTLPNLSKLSHEQKDELIISLWPLLKQVEELTARVAELEGRLALNSKNSSKPPASDGLKPKPKSLRKKDGLLSGGQKGHPGSTLRQIEQVDKVITHDVPTYCDACQSKLSGQVIAEKRQIFDLPKVAVEVTEHQVMQVRCTCGKVHRGTFPSHVTATVQYGAVAQAAMVYLNQHHMVPVQRTASFMADLFGMPLSQAIVVKACEQAKVLLTPIVAAIGQAVQTAAIAHADETGIRVNKALHWLHTLTTESLTWLACHAKRGNEAFSALGILPIFKGTLIHDGFGSYRGLGCKHGLCNAHHLRELTYVHEELQQSWAADMIALLTQANTLIRQVGKPIHDQRLDHMRYVYDELLLEGDKVNPRVVRTGTGKRGRVKQSKAANLIQRLRLYADDVWRFMTDPGVPFTNNLAEQAIRMTKIKQKISGCFRTQEGADIFCVIRSYLQTMTKQGISIFDALIQTFQGNPTQPAFYKT